jgi:uncharacterized protein (TIGR03067 family)
MHKLASLTVVAGLVGAVFLGRTSSFAQAPADTANPLEGVWKAMSLETSSVRVSDDALPELFLAYTRSDYLAAGTAGPIVGKYTLHPAGNKAAIDIEYLTGQDAGKTGRLLYEVKGDRLRIYGPLAADGARPKQFPKGGPEAGYFLAEHQRVKK